WARGRATAVGGDWSSGVGAGGGIAVLGARGRRGGGDRRRAVAKVEPVAGDRRRVVVAGGGAIGAHGERRARQLADAEPRHRRVVGGGDVDRGFGRARGMATAVGGDQGRWEDGRLGIAVLGARGRRGGGARRRAVAKVEPVAGDRRRVVVAGARAIRAHGERRARQLADAEPRHRRVVGGGDVDGGTGRVRGMATAVGGDQG